MSIPQVGSFQLIAHPATQDVASKLIHPPAYLAQYSDKDSVKEHQLNFLTLDLNADKDLVKKQLEDFGKELKSKIQKGSFSWRGIGRLENADTKIVFQPDILEIEGLQPITAAKVLRKNVQHTVLRGEQEVLSASFYNEEKTIVKKRSFAGIIGWVMVILSAAFIIFYLYQDGLSTTASGTKMKVIPANTTPTHK